MSRLGRQAQNQARRARVLIAAFRRRFFENANELGQYVVLRIWIAIISKFPVEANLFTARMVGWIAWQIMGSRRRRAMEHLRAALGDQYSEAQLQRIGLRSFQHFAQLYLVELAMTPQLVNRWTWSRYLDLGDVGPGLRQVLRDGPTILVTPHFGNFELVGYTMATLGFPLTAIMRPLDNEHINAFLERSRRAGGLTLMHKKGAMSQAGLILQRHGMLCFIADQDAGRKGVFATFFHKPASWYKSISLLAMRYHAPIIVGGATRIQDGFRYRMTMERIILPQEWEKQADPAQWITDSFAAAMEHLIRRAPEQYLWIHRRWKTQPEPASRPA